MTRPEWDVFSAPPTYTSMHDINLASHPTCSSVGTVREKREEESTPKQTGLPGEGVKR